LLARQPAMARAWRDVLREARWSGGRGPWPKMAAWSRATQRFVEATGALSGRPTLFVQTIAAFALPPSVDYAVYTDRVGREGASKGGRFASRFTPRWLERETSFLRLARHVFVMGPSTADVLVDAYGLPPDRVSVVGAGPNAILTAPRRTSEECRRILFVGTTWAQKGGPELLDAFAVLRRERPELELVVAGSSPSHDLPQGVRVVGRVPHERMDDLYSQADLLVIPSHQEAYGIALVEGFLKGLPCVTTSAGNQPTIVASAGICVEAGDVGALTDAIRTVIDGYPEYRRRAAARGDELRRTARWDRVADAILDQLDGARPGREATGA
ncbi:MAG: glycosyltransferase family 4 protein, partial [Acidimicrobiales bacterium]